jgi:acyl carrier protein
MATVQERVIAVTARVLRLDAADIKPQHSFTTDLGAESVQSVELVAAYEEEFGIEMDEDAALAVETVGAAIQFVTKNCREQGVAVN